MKLHEEFKLYEELWEDQKIVNTENVVTPEGTEVVQETEHWKICKIINYKAAQAFTSWGSVAYGKKHWLEEIADGYSYYILIDKENYDSKYKTNKIYPFIVYPNGASEVFERGYSPFSISLSSLPHNEEINIPGVDLTKASKFLDCAECERDLSAKNAWFNPQGKAICKRCFKYNYDYCGECRKVFDQRDLILHAAASTYILYCLDCVKKRANDPDGLLDVFKVVGIGKLKITDFSQDQIDAAVKAWFEAKSHRGLKLTDEYQAEVEAGFKTQAEKAGITIDLTLFN